jgi:HK97 family phage major capsid protein
MERKFENQTFYRKAEFNRAGIDEDARTAKLSFSSEEPVERYFGAEILGHKAGEIRLDRIKSGSAPLLSDHDRTCQIGVVESVSISGGKGRAVVRFSKRPEGDAEFQDVKDGIRSNVSVGYQVHAMQLVKEDENGATYRITDWEPIEISLVSIPADASVGVGRQQGASQMPIEIVNEPANEHPSTLKQVKEILAIGQRLQLNDQAREAISKGWSLEEFRNFAMDTLEKKNARPPRQSFSEIGMSQRDIACFSMIRALRCVVFPNEQKFRQDASFEIECSAAAAKVSPVETRGMRIPLDINQNWNTRTLTAGTPTGGAELVANDLLAGSFIDVLRNLSIVMALGANALEGLVGNVGIPRKTAGASAGWIALEGGDVGNSEPSFDQVLLTPKTLGTYCDMSRNLLLQSTPSIEELVKQDLAAAVATAVDKACLYGSAADGQPRGIALQVGINAPAAFAAAIPTWAEVIAMKSAVAVDNALIGTRGYAIDPAMQGSLQVTPKVEGYPVFIMGDDGEKLGGHKAAVSSQVAAGDMFFGNWSDLLIGFWGGLDLLVDPYTLGKSGGVRIIVHQSCDVAVRHPVSFAFNNDGV